MRKTKPAWVARVIDPAERVLDNIIGTKGDDHLAGTAGDDLIDGRKGRDTMAGAAGNDTYIVDDAGDVVVEAEGEGTDTVQASVSHTLAAHVEHLALAGSAALSGTGNTLANKITGNKGDNRLDGREGRDTLEGGAGNDTLIGGQGADQLSGGAGDDAYVIDDARDKVREKAGGGHDKVTSLVSWAMADHVEDLMLAEHFQRVDATGNALDNRIDGSGGINLIDGGDGNDTLHCGGYVSPFDADTLIGGAGDDVITATGTLSLDELYGGTGNDSLQSVSGILYGEDGDDLLLGGLPQGHHAVGNSLYGGAGQDTLRGGGNLQGGEGDDLIDTPIGHFADGGSGNDTITGAGGAGYTNYTVLGGEGDDTVDVLAYNHLRVEGGAGHDTLHGVGLRDVTVLGGSGNDTLLASGSGRVQMVGGEGADSFVLTTAESGGMSILIDDYTLGLDHLLVSQAALPVGNGDLVLDGATTITGPGGFDASAELVLLAEDIFGPLSLAAVAEAIGSADQAYATGQTAVFVAGNGSDTWLVYFESSGNDALVSAAELSVIGRLDGGVLPTPGEILWSD